MTREMTVYSADVKAEAIALAELYGYRPAARMLLERYPELEHIDNTYIRNWHQQIAPERFSLFQQERQRNLESNLIDLGNKAADVLYEELEKDRPGKEIVAGISLDKTLALLRVKEQAKTPHTAVQIVFHGPGRPDEIVSVG